MNFMNNIQKFSYLKKSFQQKPGTAITIQNFEPMGNLLKLDNVT